MFDMIFNSFKIKYALMDKFIEENELSYTNKKPVNIFINFDCVLKSLTSKDINDFSASNDSKKLALRVIGNIINLASHYRHYFYKRRIYTRIILFSTFPLERHDYKNRVFNRNYKKNFDDKIVNIDTPITRLIINEAIPMLKIIFEYIEDVHFITTDNLESSIIPMVYINDILVDKECDNIIISKDKFDYQYVAKGFHLFRPKGENSYCITENNLIQTLIEENELKTKEMVDASFINFINSVVGDTYRNVPKLKRVGVGTLLKFINKGIKENIISPRNNSIYLLCELVKPEFRNDLMNNYRLLDLDGQYMTITISDKYNIKSQCDNKFDNNSLKEITSRYFTDFPVYIDELVNVQKKICYYNKRTVFE